MEQGERLFVVSAPSGAGKSTLTKAVVERRPSVRLSVSSTTRPRRGDEVHGREYFFLSQTEFFERKDAGDFLEWAQVHGHYYGTSRGFVEDLLAQGYSVLFDIDVQGAEQIRKHYQAATLIFIAPPSRRELERRLRERKTDDPAEIAKRLRNAAGEIQQGRHYHYIIVNDDAERATHELETIILTRPPENPESRRVLERLVAEFSDEHAGR